MTEPSWSLGILVGVPAAISVTLLLFVWIAYWINDGYEPGIPVGLGVIGLAFTLGISAWGFYPYDKEYHQWRPVDGVVASVDKRLIGKGDGMEEKFVVVYEDGGQQYGCDDTRCAAVKPGDHLTLTCKRAWQYTGTDGYDCRFVEVRP